MICAVTGALDRLYKPQAEKAWSRLLALFGKALASLSSALQFAIRKRRDVPLARPSVRERPGFCLALAYWVQARFSRTFSEVKAAPLKRKPSAPTPKPEVKNSMIPRLPAVEDQ